MTKEIHPGSVHLEFHNEVMMADSPGAPKFLFQARIKEITIPPITDGLIIEKDAKIGTVALQKALNLLIPDHFEHVIIDDKIIADVRIISILLRRLTKERLIQFILEQIKPFMRSQDILHVQLDMEVLLTGEFK